MATTVARLQAVLSAETRDFDRAMGKSEGRMKGMAKAAALSAGAAGVGLLAVGLKKSVDAAVEAEKSQTRMETQLKALNLSYAEHGRHIDSTIQAHSRLSGFDDEDLQDSFTGLVRVTGDVNKALKANALAMDIARARGTDLDSASKLVTRALMGNSGALRRVGIDIDKNASKQEIMAALQRKFGGQAEAYGKTAAGAQDRLKVALENVMERLGQKLLPLIIRFLNWIVGDLIPSMENFKKQATRAWDAVYSTVRNVVERITLVWTRLSSTILGVFSKLYHAAGKIPGAVGAPFRRAAAEVDRAKGKVDNLHDAIQKRRWNRQINVTAEVAVKFRVPSGISRVEEIRFNGRSGDISAAEEAIAQQIKNGLPRTGTAYVAGFPATPMGQLDRRLWEEASMARAMGLTVGSTYRPGATVRGSGSRSDHSYFPSKAMDVFGSSANMARFARSVAGQPGVDTVIYSPLGIAYNGGRGFSPIISDVTRADHYDHVHVDTFHKGGVYRAPRTGGEGLALLRDREVIFTPEQMRYLGGGRGGSQTTVIFNGPVYGDEEAIARKVTDAVARRERRNGR